MSNKTKLAGGAMHNVRDSLGSLAHHLPIGDAAHHYFQPLARLQLPLVA